MDSRPRTRSRPSTIRTCEAVTDVAPAATLRQQGAASPRGARRGVLDAAKGPITLLPLPVRYR